VNPEESIADLTVRELLNGVASREVTPSGGAVAAVGGAADGSDGTPAGCDFPGGDAVEQFADGQVRDRLLGVHDGPRSNFSAAVCMSLSPRPQRLTSRVS